MFVFKLIPALASLALLVSAAPVAPRPGGFSSGPSQGKPIAGGPPVQPGGPNKPVTTAVTTKGTTPTTSSAVSKPTSAAGGCDTSFVVMDLPSGQTNLTSPTTAPKFAAVGLGFQNYTCSATTSKYTSTGAVASILDASCLGNTPAFANIQTAAFKAWSASSSTNGLALSSIGKSIGTPNQLGTHFFITAASGTGLSPEWDFTQSLGSSAFVVAAKSGDIAAPTAPTTNVDWLQLGSVSGSLATKIFRVDTVGGQPPTSCVPGTPDIQVKYAAKYILY